MYFYQLSGSVTGSCNSATENPTSRPLVPVDKACVASQCLTTPSSFVSTVLSMAESRNSTMKPDAKKGGERASTNYDRVIPASGNTVFNTVTDSCIIIGSLL
jgi:hypothetical protein